MKSKQWYKDPYLRNSSLLIFLILCVNKLGFRLSGGEEQYLAMAKQFIDPQWIPNSFTLTEFAGTRIVFQTIIGTWLKWADFETVAFYARLINYALISIPLTMLFRKLKVNYAGVFIVFQLFVMSKQSLLGLEWMFDSFEPKSIAYIFLFFALNKVLDNRYSTAVVFLALSTYFHILVGGWFFITLLIYLSVKGKIREGIKAGLLYGLLCLPFAVYLFYGYFLNPAPETNINLDQVYVYKRLPHHLGIFKRMDYFLKYHAWGVVLTILALTFGWWRLKKEKGKNMKTATSLMLIMLGINLFFVGVAWADRYLLDSSGGLLLKYYPFRTNSLATFILFNLLYSHGKKYAVSWGIPRSLQIAVLSLLIVLAVVQGINNMRRNIALPVDLAFDEMALYIKKNTDKKAVFIITGVPYNSDLFSSFGRKAERENFLVFKFVAAEKHKLLEWYRRFQVFSILRKDISCFPEYSGKYKIDYVVSRKLYTEPGLELEYQNTDYYLYRVNP